MIFLTAVFCSSVLWWCRLEVGASFFEVLTQNPQSLKMFLGFFRPHPLVLKCHTTHVPRSWGFILFFRRCKAWQKHRTVRNGDSKNQELPKSCQRVCRILDLFVHVCSLGTQSFCDGSASRPCLGSFRMFKVSLFPCFMFVRTFLFACLSSRFCTILIDFVRSCVTLCHPCCAPQQGM